jgi:integrase
VLPALGDHRLNAVEKEDVERLIYDMEEDARSSGRKLKAGGYGTREKTLRALQRFFSEMVANGRIAKNPALGVRPGSRPSASIDGGGWALEVEQVTSLVEATPEYWRPLVALLATSGLRISEALGLRRRDLDLAAGRATIRQTVVACVIGDLHQENVHQGTSCSQHPLNRIGRRPLTTFTDVTSTGRSYAASARGTGGGRGRLTSVGR